MLSLFISICCFNKIDLLPSLFIDMSVDVQGFYERKRNNLIKEFEQFRANPYLDSEGIPTIGYGTTRYPDGREVTMNDPAISLEKANDFFNTHIDEFTDKLSENESFRSLTPAQQAALGSFAYNAGPNVLSTPNGYNTLQRAVASGDSDSIADAMRLYVNPGSASEAGLKRRREAEIELMRTEPPMPPPLPVPSNPPGGLGVYTRRP
jgi:lysozyme